jgi:hypothetical protein
MFSRNIKNLSKSSLEKLRLEANKKIDIYNNLVYQKCKEKTYKCRNRVCNCMIKMIE